MISLRRSNLTNAQSLHKSQGLTQNHGHGLHEADNSLIVRGLIRVRGHQSTPAANVDEDVRVDGHHDEKGQEVEDGPEH